MLWRRRHNGEHATDVIERHIAVEQVAHGVDEDVTATGPAPRLVKRVWVDGQSESRPRRPGITVGPVLTLAHRLQALGEGHGIAAVTSR
jgi:hypothetical protein